MLSIPRSTSIDVVIEMTAKAELWLTKFGMGVPTE